MIDFLSPDSLSQDHFHRAEDISTVNWRRMIWVAASESLLPSDKKYACYRRPTQRS
ncbi:predicted protein [Botrytis cinerea T4]|uniref:Uncharacterized protein n=1 Tax=Botryotinia fuckeliana (strain T4) TaxID=999810 RepID=G2YP10_BOTF4|nr:predicted protein [Botrytis cinerea T4]